MRNLWHTSATHDFFAPELTSSKKSEVVIIGGGYTGCSCALHSAKHGMDVSLVEANQIGWGCSGRNSGNLNPGLWLTAEQITSLIGQKYGDRLNALLRNGPIEVGLLAQQYDIDCEFNDAGTLHCSSNIQGLRELEKRVASQQSQGMNSALLDENATSKILGTSFYKASISNKDAASIQPLAYLRGLANAAVSSGAKVYENSSAIKVSHENSRWIVSTPTGEISAKWLVVATDAYHNSLKFGSTNNMSNLWYFNCATDILPEKFDHILPDKQGCWDTETIMTSFTRDQDGRLIAGSVGRLGSLSSKIHIGWMKRRVAQIFPELSGIEFKFSWHGSMGMTPNHLPRITNLGERALGIFGYSGRGIAPGTMFGKAISNYIHTNDEDLLPLPITTINSYLLKRPKEIYYDLGSIVTHLFGARSTHKTPQVGAKTQ